MATKPAAATETAAPEVEADANVLDTQSAAVKRLIAKGKERGYITFDELNAVLPAEQNSSEQIEDIMAMLSEMGIQVVESEEGEDPEAAAVAQGRGGRGRGRPGRQYLRELGQPHRRPGAHVSARDGHGGAAVARGRDRHRQAHRGRAGHDDPRACAKAR